MEAAVTETSEVRRWAARIVFVGGAVAMLVFFSPRLPRDQSVVFRVGHDVRRLEANFTKRGESEPRRGLTLSFGEGAPRSIMQSVSLPNGAYDVAVAIERRSPDGSPTETSYVRHVTLEGGETVLALEDAK
jgi:hypothetical protein